MPFFFFYLLIYTCSFFIQILYISHIYITILYFIEWPPGMFAEPTFFTFFYFLYYLSLFISLSKNMCVTLLYQKYILNFNTFYTVFTTFYNCPNLLLYIYIGDSDSKRGSVQIAYFIFIYLKYFDFTSKNTDIFILKKNIKKTYIFITFYHKNISILYPKLHLFHTNISYFYSAEGAIFISYFYYIFIIFL